MKKELNPAAFSVKQGQRICATEMNHLATFRLQLKGTRTVVMVSLQQLVQFLALSLTLKSLTLKEVYNQFKIMSDDKLREFLSSNPGDNKLYYCTVGPLDIVYVPTGFIFYEKVGNNDSVGVYARTIMVGSLPAYEMICRHLALVGKGMPVTQAVLDTLILQS